MLFLLIKNFCINRMLIMRLLTPKIIDTNYSYNFDKDVISQNALGYFLSKKLDI